jgi:putative addiction module killer protein
MNTILHYLDARGRDIYQDWVSSLRDRQAKIAVIRRVARLEMGLLGDHRSVGGGVQELRLDIGPGYRIYYAFVDQAVILLTCGGDKSSQKSDIVLALELLHDWRKRHEHPTPFP